MVSWLFYINSVWQADKSKTWYICPEVDLGHRVCFLFKHSTLYSIFSLVRPLSSPARCYLCLLIHLLLLPKHVSHFFVAVLLSRSIIIAHPQLEPPVSVYQDVSFGLVSHPNPIGWVATAACDSKWISQACCCWWLEAFCRERFGWDDFIAGF